VKSLKWWSDRLIRTGIALAILGVAIRVSASAESTPLGTARAAVQPQETIALGTLQGTNRTRIETVEFVVNVGGWNGRVAA
jgi:hypothetical protein